MQPLTLPGGFPNPSAADLTETGRRLSATKGPALIDGLAFGAMPADLIRALPHAPVALCHHPLGLEAGLTDAEAAAAIETERRALALAAHVIAPSEATRAILISDFGLPAGKITVALPGLDLPSVSEATGPATPPEILTVASLTRRKGHDILARALTDIADLEWRAVWAGPDDRDPAFASELKDLIKRSGLTGRIDRHGPLPRAALDALYREASIFCLPSRYEGYGMVFAEAMAHGLPVVAARLDTFGEFMARDAALLVPQEDPAALARALRRLLRSPGERKAMGAAGEAAARSLPGWDDAWAVICQVMRAVA